VWRYEYRIFVGWPDDPKACQNVRRGRRDRVGTYREGLLSETVDDLELKDGWEMYKRCISLPENRKNMWEMKTQLLAPAILPGSRCGFGGKESEGGFSTLARWVVTDQVGVTGELSHQP